MSKVYLVGVGPGDPELLTLKAARIIAQADIVAFPQKPDEQSLALKIAQAHVSVHSDKLPIEMPMQVDRKAGEEAYDRGAAQIAEFVNAGKTLVYLCEGDPLFYGSAMYFLDRLPENIDVEIVPGITSMTAAAAATKRPLAARSDRLKVLPATLDAQTLRVELNSSEAVAIIKVGRHLPKLRKIMAETDHENSAIIVEYATHETRERISRLSEYQPETAPYFSILLTYGGDEAWGTQ